MSYSKHLIIYEIISLYLIMLFGSQIIKLEFHEYILVSQSDMKYFDNHRIFGYFIEIITHLVINIIVYKIICLFKNVKLNFNNKRFKNRISL